MNNEFRDPKMFKLPTNCSTERMRVVLDKELIEKRTAEMNLLTTELGLTFDRSKANRYLKHLEHAKNGRYAEADALFLVNPLRVAVEANDSVEMWKVARALAKKPLNQIERTSFSVMSDFRPFFSSPSGGGKDLIHEQCVTVHDTARELRRVCEQLGCEEQFIDALGIHAMENEMFCKRLKNSGWRVSKITKDPVLFSETVRDQATVQAIEAGIIRDEGGIRTCLDNQKQKTSAGSRRI